MVDVNGPMLLILVLCALGYYTTDKVKEPIKKTGHAICHVVTFGKKCANPK